MHRPVPILFLSDAPDQKSGLARIGRDLATLLARNHNFRVGYLGYGGTGSRIFPFAQYHMQPNEFGELSLPAVWDDFAGDDIGIVFTIWDLSRLLWLARPEFVEDQGLRTWLQGARGKRFKLWSYLPIDSTGQNGRLTGQSAETLLGIDRLLAYSPWAVDVVKDTIGPEESAKRGLDWMPHGINGATFTSFGDPFPLHTEFTRIGVVATNQARKDWGLAAQTCAILKDKIQNLRLWWHVDVDVRHWNIQALLADFGLTEITEVTHYLTDQELAARYRGCSVTIAPGLGEGFGYPIFESLACGVPVVHGDYGGGASIMETCGLKGYLVPPVTFRLETQHNCQRPVFHPAEFADYVDRAFEEPACPPRESVEHLFWNNLWPTWERWFVEGIE